MEWLPALWWNWIAPGVVLLTVLIFVHEYGHFWVARRCGVRVETFSIGFGRELVGWSDRRGTRWKIGWLPLGGYVKMYGDADAASTPDEAAAAAMTEEQRRHAFQHQPLAARAAIVAAGPIANFLFAVLIFAALFVAYGRPFTPPVIASVKEGFPAARAGVLPGDRVVAIDGRPVERFEQIQREIMLSIDRPVSVRLLRDGAPLDVVVTPVHDLEIDRFGNSFRVPRIGVRSAGERDYQATGAPWAALGLAVEETWVRAATQLTAVWQILSGRRSTEEVGGLISIARISGEAARMGWTPFIEVIAMMSISLGLLNLFPIPMLDGGHLLYYAIEAVRRRPLGPRAQEFGFRVGFAIVVVLLVSVNAQDVWLTWLKDSSLVKTLVNLVS